MVGRTWGTMTGWIVVALTLPLAVGAGLARGLLSPIERRVMLDVFQGIKW